MPTSVTTTYGPVRATDEYVKTYEFLPGFKVRFVSAADTTDILSSCFNPESLELRVGVDIGRLGPAGWSHETQQYARTTSVSFPLRLDFSAIHMRDGRGGDPYTDDPQGPIRWFMKHCYPSAKGRAPDPILVVWPGTLILVCVVNSMNVTMTRWDSKGVLTNYTIDLELTELRREFRGAGVAASSGFVDNSSWDRTLAGGASGKPLNFGRTGGKFRK